MPRARRAAEESRCSHAKLSWLKANLPMKRRVDNVPSGMSARSGAVTVAETRTPRHSGAPPLYLRPQIRRRLRERQAGRFDGTKPGTAGWTAKAFDSLRARSARAAIRLPGPISVPLLGRRPQRAVGPLLGRGVVQRIVIAGAANVPVPVRRRFARNSRHRLAARRAQLSARVEHSHRIFPCRLQLISPYGVGAIVSRKVIRNLPRPLTYPPPDIEIGLSVMLRGWRRGRVLQRLRAAGARSR